MCALFYRFTLYSSLLDGDFTFRPATLHSCLLRRTQLFAHTTSPAKIDDIPRRDGGLRLPPKPLRSSQRAYIQSTIFLNCSVISVPRSPSALSLGAHHQYIRTGQTKHVPPLLYQPLHASIVPYLPRQYNTPSYAPCRAETHHRTTLAFTDPAQTTASPSP